MTVKDFVKKYVALQTDSDRERFLKKHIKDEYIPYEKKITICRVILDNSCYETVISGKTETKVFRVNSPKRYFNYCIALIRYYTDLEFDPNDITEEFNLLDRNDLIDILVALISDKEVDKFKTILNMMFDDLIDRERSIGGITENLCRNVEMFLSPILKSVDEMLSPETMSKILSGILEDTIKENGNGKNKIRKNN